VFIQNEQPFVTVYVWGLSLIEPSDLIQDIVSIRKGMWPKVH